MGAAGKLSVVYDGQCGFCLRALTLFRRVDLLDRIELIPSQRTDVVQARFPQLAGADFEHAMFAVDPAGRAYRGFYAFRRMIWTSPVTWLLLPLFYFPGASFAGTRLYAWVAAHRRNLGCGSEVCALPEGPKPGPDQRKDAS